jgi:hypothetical protein
VFDPTKNNDVLPVCGDLLDNLLDIYKDLKESILLYDNSKSTELGNAVWTFKWNFENHWGDHCINAIYAIHYLIKDAFE